MALALALIGAAGAARAQSADATLSALRINDGTQDVTLTKTGGDASAGFAAAHEIYAAAQVTVRAVTLTPSATAAGATIQTGKRGATLSTVESGAGATHVLRIGANTLVVRVTAPDGMTRKTYRVTIRRGGARHDDAGLSVIKIFDVDDEAELADIDLAGSAERMYSQNVPFKADGIDFQVVPADENFHSMVMSVPEQVSPPLDAGGLRDDAVVEDGFSVTVRLTQGIARAVTFVVTAEDRTTTLTYVVSITREAPGDTPAVTIDREFYFTDEDEPLEITVSLSSPAPAVALVTYMLTDEGDPAKEVQYTLAPASPLTFEIGESEKTLTLTPTDNAYIEDDNVEIEIEFGVPNGYQAGDTVLGEIDIFDDEFDERAFIVFGADIDLNSAYTVTANEGETVLLPVAIGASAAEEISFRIRVDGGSAASGDYRISEPDLRFAARDTGLSRNISIEILDDAAVEGAETIILKLENLGVGDLNNLYETTPGSTAVLTISPSDRSDDATLSALLLSTGAGDLAPRFAADTVSYTLAVPNKVASVQFLPDVKESAATVRIDNVELVSGASVQIALTVGVPRVILAVVTAPDRVTTNTYTVTATRVRTTASTDATLSGLRVHAGSAELTLTKTGSLSTPGFDAAHETYSATPEIAHTFAGVTLTPSAANSSARITIAGADVKSGEASELQPVVFGDNAIAVVVTAQDAVSTKTYTLVVARAAGPPLAPREFTITAADKALRFGWSRHVDDNGAKISGYKVRWKRADASEYAAQDIMDASGISLSLSDIFLIGAAYTAQVAAVNVIGIGAWSEEQSATPLCETPSKLSVRKPLLRNNKLLLSWLPPQCPNEALRDYRVRWRLADDNGRPGAWQKASGATDPADPADGESLDTRITAYAVTGLRNATTYQVQVTARNRFGAGAWSDARSGAPERGHGLDVDEANGNTWQDGVMIARYLLGLRGTALTAGLSDAPPGTPESNIAASIANMNFDVDRSRTVTAADGMLIARYLLGVRGDALVAGTRAKARVVEDAVAALQAQ
ncbi:MAG: cadherin-like beta sandwich domain-containing protein [Gammaproteobacteria bacterium]